MLRISLRLMPATIVRLEGRVCAWCALLTKWTKIFPRQQEAFVADEYLPTEGGNHRRILTAGATITGVYDNRRPA